MVWEFYGIDDEEVGWGEGWGIWMSISMKGLDRGMVADDIGLKR